MLLLTVKAKEEAEAFFTAGRYRSNPTIILLKIKTQYLAIYICSIYFIDMALPRSPEMERPWERGSLRGSAVRPRKISRTMQNVQKNRDKARLVRNSCKRSRISGRRFSTPGKKLFSD